MTKRYVFDIETNGLLPELTTVPCIGLLDLDTGEQFSYHGAEVRLGIHKLECADLIVGHNVIGFDLPAIRKVFPRFSTGALVRDTLVLSRLFWPHIADDDFKRVARPGSIFPKNMIGRHSLEAWGYRIGSYKGDFKGPWDQWTPEMSEYMDQDVVVTRDLYARCAQIADDWKVPLEDRNPPARKDCVELEHAVAFICVAMEQHGFRFDVPKAAALHGLLAARKAELEAELHQAFPPRVVRSTFIPKVNNRKLGYQKGVPIERVTEVPFNPASRQEVGRRLRELGWQPSAFGKDGHPTVDDTILGELPYPQAKVLAEFFMILKRLGQVAEGREAWFRHERNGRIHGRIQSNGAHTGRATHSNPNMGQIPGAHAPYGKECRACFTADVGHKLVGCDQDGLELRGLGAFLAAWDDGEFVTSVVSGDKALGTDAHSRNAALLGCARDVAKVAVYALIYGAGDAKLGETLGFTGRAAGAAGKRARAALLAGIPALDSLIKTVRKTIERRGYLIGLDGRRLYPRSENAALNTLIQSAGAIICKRWMVLTCQAAAKKGWAWGQDYAIVAWVHDELQMTARPAIAEALGQLCAEAAAEAGRFYDFKCPTVGNYDIGDAWADTH